MRRNPKSLARHQSRFAFSRSDPNCGWSVDGTVAANTKSYENFIVLHFWHALELRKCRTAKSTHRIGWGRHQRQNIAGRERNAFAVWLWHPPRRPSDALKGAAWNSRSVHHSSVCFPPPLPYDGTRNSGRQLPSADRVEPIKSHCGMSEEIGLFCTARAFCQKLAGIPKDRIAVGALVDREVAFEHRAR